jgi:hypothetical protein
MADLYFTGDWMIRPSVNYARLVEIAYECGCALAIAQANIVTPDKFVWMRFALHAPTQDAFNNFAAKVGQAVGLDRWQTTTAESFERAQPFDLHLLDADFLTRWMEAMHAYGLHNAELLRQRTAQS